MRGVTSKLKNSIHAVMSRIDDHSVSFSCFEILTCETVRKRETHGKSTRVGRPDISLQIDTQTVVPRVTFITLNPFPSSSVLHTVHKQSSESLLPVTVDSLSDVLGSCA